MEAGDVTTPFGRRAVTLAQVKGQIAVGSTLTRQPVDKWKVLRDLCDARAELGLRDRAIAVLTALLSFHPAIELSADQNLIVFPSNAQLSARANGIAGTTLRENLNLLVKAGIIHRRDSPNGKRYARKGDDGRLEAAYGFSLAPLLARATEFAVLAQAVVAQRRQMRILRERITLLRRDVRKLISAVSEEVSGIDWSDIEADFRALIATASRARCAKVLSEAEQAFARMKQDILNRLENYWKTEKTDTNGNESRFHIQNQKPESIHDFERALEGKPGNGETGSALPDMPVAETPAVANEPNVPPLGMVTRYCPDIVAYGPRGQVSNWRELMAAAVVVRSMLGVSPSAYQEACEVMGPERAATVIACILERAGQINSAGGYLRTLTRKAVRGEFSLVSMMMAAAQERKNVGGCLQT
ncbi:replication initiation protein RepC 1-2 (plasmid) [Rhizobium etli 8C-3]|uniref:Replication initiation protein RepC 1-2 n=1 Tax=Rhizobium etli 8C-3 TaxID=538025 RepID=A0A1L5PAK6_RHIET|nr:plasmid replication protein RepC [Rhizobium etli]APO77122.1 replication initiation protein RepC 1-2 [Rhizobium etli 8C-3]